MTILRSRSQGGRWTARSYGLAAGLLGAAATLIAVGILSTSGVRQDTALLVALGTASGWLRFRLSSTAYLTLTPLAFFLALLLVQPSQAFVVAVLSGLLGALTFRRLPLRAILRDLGEQVIPALGAVLSLIAYVPDASPATGRSAPSFVAAAIAYVMLRILVNLVSAHIEEGVGIRNFLAVASANTALNLIFLAAIAFGLRYSLFDRFGYLSLVLVTIALIEIYQPWKLLSEQEEILFANLAMIAQAIDMKDPYTAEHSRGVAQVAVKIARAMGLPESEVRKIRIAALMHDIGKIGVSGRIIRKPGKLSEDEDHAMRAHPVISADIMQPIELLAGASQIVRHHHEHCDGSGYPDGLKREDIPIGSRVVLVADAFDAMTTDRPYRAKRSKEEALKVLKDHAGRQFDPDVVSALERILPTLQ